MTSALEWRGARPRRGRAAILLLAGILIAGPFAAGGSAQQTPADLGDVFCPEDPERMSQHGVWIEARVPAFRSGPSQITEHAIEYLRPFVIFITNGRHVLRSPDLGCNWEEVYSLPDQPTSGAPYSAADSQIVAIRTGGPGFVYLGIQKGGVAPKPFVVRTTNGGESWEEAWGGDLRAVVGQMRDLAVPLSDSASAYLLVDVASGSAPVKVTAAQTLFATTDKGDEWELRQTFDNGGSIEVPGLPTVEISPNLEFSRMTVDHLRPQELWLYGPAGLWRSTDGGGDFSEQLSAAVGFVEVARPGPEQPPRVLAFAAQGDAMWRSVDDGASFPPGPGPAGVDSGGHGDRPQDTIVGAAGRVYRQAAGGTRFVPVPTEGRSIVDVEVGKRFLPFGAPLTAVGRTASTLEISVLEDAPVGDLPGFDPVHLSGSRLADLGDGLLQPRWRKVVLGPGQSRRVTYRLTLPPTPTPLDVYFLIDVSSSMDDTINGVRHAMQEIVDRLHGQGIDVHFGVGVYRAFSDPPAYNRVRDIGPVNPELEEALNDVHSRGGGDETQLFALKRSAVDDGNDFGSRDDPFTFRPGSLRVAIHSTDEPFSTGPPHPSYPEVIDALVEAGVQQVGLAIQEGEFLGGEDTGPETPAHGLLEVARGTDTVAPMTGVDCDGDDATDIPPGEPMVCLIPPGRSNEAALMADAIVNVLDAVRDINKLEVQASIPTDADDDGAGLPEVVAGIRPSELDDVDLKEPNDLPFSVLFSCPRLERRTAFPVEISVVDAGRVLGRAQASVVCRVPDEQEERIPLLGAFVPLAGLPPPPPRPPDPVAEPNPNPQPNSQSNPQAQAGLASQEQEQPQAAVAHQEAQGAPAAEEAGGDHQYLMTRHADRSGPAPAAVFLTSAVVMTLLYGFATMRREQIRTQQAHARRRR